MIKLIATDMDGTLLDENGNLPENFFKTLNKLNKMNIKFVVASGRSYSTLYKNFKPVSDDICYICDNGAFIVEYKNICDVNIINKKDVHDIIKTCSDIPNIQLVLCGLKGSHHMMSNEIFSNEMNQYYSQKYITEDLRTVDDDIFKIAICDLSIAAENSYKILYPKYHDNFSIVVSGKLWVDIMNKNVSKGKALEKMQKDLNISYNETMVFGDFYNDSEMLQKAYYSFVMENANDDMKQYGNFIAKSNRENGVIKAIEEYIFI